MKSDNFLLQTGHIVNIYFHIVCFMRVKVKPAGHLTLALDPKRVIFAGLPNLLIFYFKLSWVFNHMIFLS
jgi:hypothetical protein